MSVCIVGYEADLTNVDQGIFDNDAVAVDEETYI